MPGSLNGPRRYRQRRRARARIGLAAGVALILAAGGTAVALIVTRAGGHRELPQAVSLVGDSLNVGIEPYLATELRDWQLSTDDVPGRA